MKLPYSILVTSLALAGLTASAGAAAQSPSQPFHHDRRSPPAAGAQRYSLEQAVSDEAQLHTIAFDGLAFLTGNLGASTFFPPGKVVDFFGFQYMRDIDATGKGHNPMFLGRITADVLSILTPAQRKLFAQEAAAEAPLLRGLGLGRFPLIKAFHRQLSGDIPADSDGLNAASVKRYTGKLFTEDAEIAYRRAEVFGKVAASLDDGQRASLSRLRFGDFRTWPAVDMEQYKLPRGTEPLVQEGYMTLASQFFSWTAGSLYADTYFCPERHGTYFGGFYLKDAPAMGKRDFDISKSLTGDAGAGFMRLLNPAQRRIMFDIIERQRKPMAEIVDVRRSISKTLRRFLHGEKADYEKILSLGRRYGELDGELAWLYATAFARINQSLTEQQLAELKRLRNADPSTAAPAYLYSQPMSRMPATADETTLFLAPK